MQLCKLFNNYLGIFNAKDLLFCDKFDSFFNDRCFKNIKDVWSNFGILFKHFSNESNTSFAEMFRHLL